MRLIARTWRNFHAHEVYKADHISMLCGEFGDGAADGDGDGTANGGNGSDDGGTSSRKTTPSPGRPKKNNPPKPPGNAAKPKTGNKRPRRGP